MKKKKVFSLSFGTMFLSCFEEERKRIDGVYKVYLLVCQLPSAISEQIFRQIQHEFLPKIKPAKSIVHLCTDHFKPYNKTTYLCKRKRLLSKIFMQISCCWPTNFWIGEIFFFCCLFNTCNTTAITKHNNNRVQLSKVTPRWLKKKKKNYISKHWHEQQQSKMLKEKSQFSTASYLLQTRWDGTDLFFVWVFTLKCFFFWYFEWFQVVADNTKFFFKLDDLAAQTQWLAN